MPKMYATPICSILYCLALTQKDIEAIRDEFDIPESILSKADSQGYASFIHSDTASIVVVQIDDTNIDDKLAALALIVHEATHVKQYLCEHIGEYAPSAEFEAYTIQQIAQNLFVEYEANNAKFNGRQDFAIEIDDEVLNGLEV